MSNLEEHIKKKKKLGKIQFREMTHRVNLQNSKVVFGGDIIKIMSQTLGLYLFITCWIYIFTGFIIPGPKKSTAYELTKVNGN